MQLNIRFGATYGRVHINETQYFDNVPLAAWEFYIGGYQPAQKWIKDRKLEFDDIWHYQKIIVVLTETDRLKPFIFVDLESKQTFSITDNFNNRNNTTFSPKATQVTRKFNNKYDLCHFYL